MPIEGRAKLDSARARRRSEVLLRELGVRLLALRSGRAVPGTPGEIDRLVNELQVIEAEYGSLVPEGATARRTSPNPASGREG